MTLLIVDDEFYLVQGVKGLLNWADYGIDTVLEAYSAQQAREIYESNQIDILLADVEMPKENGLSLIRWVRENEYNSVNILLTGYESFEYARRAIELQIMDYLVKPPTRQMLADAVTRAVEKIRREAEERRSAVQMRMTTFWRSLYSGALSPDPDTIALYFNKYNLFDVELSNEYYYLYLTITLPLSAVDNGSGEPSFPGILSLLREEFTQDTWLAAVDTQGYMVSVGTSMDPEKVPSAAEAVIKRLSLQHPNYRFVLYLFDTAPLAAAPYACELLQQFAVRILPSDSCVVSVTDAMSGGAHIGDREDVKDLPLSRWAEWILAGRTQDVYLQIKALLGRTETLYSSRYLSAIYYGLLHAVFTALTGHEESLTVFSENASQAGDLSQIIASPENLLRFAELALREVSSILTKADDTGTVLEQVRIYVRDHLSDPSLDRGMIADAVHMSPDYLSYIFHKQSGSTLSAYITGERIAAAKKLLLTTDASGQEIAERVGFSGVPYFHKQFKKCTGTTPNAYRQKRS